MRVRARIEVRMLQGELQPAGVDDGVSGRQRARGAGVAGGGRGGRARRPLLQRHAARQPRR